MPSYSHSRSPGGSGWERRSTTTIFGLPLFHAAGGKDPFTGKKRTACGVLAVGQRAFGVVAVCQFGVGIVALAQFGVAALFGAGQFMLAPAAVGQFVPTVFGAAGQFAIGFWAAGQFAAGPTDNIVGQTTVGLGSGVLAGIATALPAVIGWLITAALLRSSGADASRAAHARRLPRIKACSISELRPGPVVLRGFVARGQGTVFEATESWGLLSEQAGRLRVPELVVQDDSGTVQVQAANAMLFIAARGSILRLGEGDVVEVEGMAHPMANPYGVQYGFREAPSRWTVEARTIVGNQSIRTVSAMAHFPRLLAVPMVLAALVCPLLAAALGLAQPLLASIGLG